MLSVPVQKISDLSPGERAYFTSAVTPIATEQEIDIGLHANGGDVQILALNDIRLSLNKTDPGHRTYFSKDWYFETTSAFYAHVQNYLKPKWVFDLGGNHGVSSTLAGKRMPGAKVVAVEPLVELIKHIKYNLYSNRIEDFEVVEGVVGAEAGETSFFLNPNGSLDSRVKSPGPHWNERRVRQVTFDMLSRDVADDDPVYIKADIQGFEPYFMQGAQTFFGRNHRFIMKMEYGPSWVESQGSDPVEFLRDLAGRFDVYEFPSRFALGRGLDRQYLGQPMEAARAGEWSEAIAANYRDGFGAIDLLITPKGMLPEAPPA